MTNDQLELIYPTRRANIDGDLSENRSKDLIKILVDHAFDLTLSAFTDMKTHTSSAILSGAPSRNDTCLG